MRAATLQQSGKHLFYGWWIVIGATLGWALNGGVYFYGFGTFFLPLQSTFGVGRAAISGAISLSRMETGLLGPIGGFLVDRFGPRRIMLFGVALQGTGFILLSQVTTIYQFYVVFVLLVAFGGGLGFAQPLMAAVANWFIRRRGLAFGIATSGIGLGGFIVPGLAWIITTYGWRVAFVFSGLTTWAVGIPIALLMRHRPEQYGYLPDGAAPQEVDFTARQALKTSAFWLLGVAFALRVMVSGSMVIHLVPFMQDSGISTGIAALALGSLAVTSVVGRLGFGWLGDRFGRKQMVMLALVLMTLSMFVVSLATATWHIAVFFVLYAPAYGGLASMMHALRGDYFGRTAFATITGFMSTLMAAGTIIGPFFAGYVYDTTGSYRIAFATFAFASLLSLALIAVVRRPTLEEPPTEVHPAPVVSKTLE